MIDVNIRGKIAVLTMQHGKANAMDLEFLRAMDKQMELLETQADCHGVVITGQGSIFSAGVDLKQLVEGGAEYIEPFIAALGAVFRRVFLFSKPVVVACNGHAIAGGGILLLCGDRRLLAEGRARVGIPELQVGVVFPTLALEIVRFALPIAELQRAVYSGELVTGEELLARGWVESVVPAEELINRAIAEAEALASIPAQTFAQTKRMLRRPVEAAVAAAGADQDVLDCWLSPDTLEHIHAYISKTLK